MTFQKYHLVSVAIGLRKMKRSLFDSSIQDASNGSIFMSLASIDEKIFAFFCFKKFGNISSTIDARDMQIPSFDASRHDESNKLSFILLQSLDAEIFQFEYFGRNAFFKKFCQFLHYKCHDVSMNIDRRKMKRSLFDSSIQDASNGSIFMSLASIDEKLFAFFCFKKFGYIL